MKNTPFGFQSPVLAQAKLLGQETLAKAIRFNIPFDKQSINWLSLISKVEKYEYLIAEAKKLNVDWDYNYYDPVGLEQEIEVCQHEAYLEKNDLYVDFCSTRGVEV